MSKKEEYQPPTNLSELQEVAKQQEEQANQLKNFVGEDGMTMEQSIMDMKAKEELESIKNLNDDDSDKIAGYMAEHGVEKYEYLVRGANLRCRYGSHCRKLNLPKDHAVYTTTYPMLHELDCIAGDEWNISYFGVCDSPKNHNGDILLKRQAYDECGNPIECEADLGNVHGTKCEPIIIGTWMNTYDATRIVDNGDKDPQDRLQENPKGYPSVTTNSFLLCKYGGLIEPLSSGQDITESEEGKPEKDSWEENESPAKEGEDIKSETPEENTNTGKVDVHDNGDIPTNAAIEITPPVTNAEGQRNPEAYRQILESVNVDENLRYVDKEGKGRTYCNIYVWDMTSAMGCEIPHYMNGDEPSQRGDGLEVRANRTFEWLAECGSTYGWRSITQEEAVERANQGYPTIVVWQNPNSGDSGHIAMLSPQLNGDTETMIAQAGSTNFNYGTLQKGFGNPSGLRFYTHD